MSTPGTSAPSLASGNTVAPSKVERLQSLLISSAAGARARAAGSGSLLFSRSVDRQPADTAVRVSYGPGTKSCANRMMRQASVSGKFVGSDGSNFLAQSWIACASAW